MTDVYSSLSIESRPENVHKNTEIQLLLKILCPLFRILIVVDNEKLTKNY
jgi:hypothetical protein